MPEYTNTNTYANIILIPYRNRKEHLDIFITNAIPLFDKYLKPFKVVIIEQEDGKLFNRGMLLNIGFKEYKDKTQFFFTHDVDTIPTENCVRDLYTKTNNDVIRIYSPHPTSFGKVCKFTHNSIFDINGFPNYIWGWGIEDRALYYRYFMMNKSISPNFANDINFHNLHHISNVETYINEKKIISDRENTIFNCNNKDIQIQHIMSSGLNNLQYKIINRINLDNSIYLGNNIEIITVSL
jgi:beta-1,4-galactosyltransferase 1